MQNLISRVSSKGGEVKTKVESGDPDCPVTMYCRVRVSVFQNGVKLTESTATGISKIHAESRAAFKIIEVIHLVSHYMHILIRSQSMKAKPL